MGIGKEVPAAAVPKKLKMPDKAKMDRQKGDRGIKPTYRESIPYKNKGPGSPSPKMPPNRTK